MNPSTAILNGLVEIVDKIVRKMKKDGKEPFLVAQRKKCSPVEYYVQHRSLRIGLPRRSGNTQLALMLLNKHPKSIYIADTLDAARETESRFKNKAISRKRIFDISMHDIFSAVELSPDIVITDCIDYVYNKESVVEQMYSILAAFHPIYIHLG
jgi:hypothetical protein